MLFWYQTRDAPFKPDPIFASWQLCFPVVNKLYSASLSNILSGNLIDCGLQKYQELAFLLPSFQSWQAGRLELPVFLQPVGPSELELLFPGHKSAFVFKLKGLISTGHLHASLHSLANGVLVWSASPCPNAQGLTIFITATPLPSPRVLKDF